MIWLWMEMWQVHTVPFCYFVWIFLSFLFCNCFITCDMVSCLHVYGLILCLSVWLLFTIIPNYQVFLTIMCCWYSPCCFQIACICATRQEIITACACCTTCPVVCSISYIFHAYTKVFLVWLELDILMVVYHHLLFCTLFYTINFSRSDIIASNWPWHHTLLFPTTASKLAIILLDHNNRSDDGCSRTGENEWNCINAFSARATL